MPQSSSSIESPATACVLGVMAKYWQPGQVKTRLAATLSPPSEQTAAAIHREFLRHLASQWKASDGLRLEWVISPISRAADFASLADSPSHQLPLRPSEPHSPATWHVVDQGQGSLGDRMRRWFENQVGRHRHPVLIGADCPTITPSVIERTCGILTQGHDLVLGPAFDGGYYLIAMNRQTAPNVITTLTREIDWGSDRVLEQTLQAAESESLSTVLLETRRDVDNSDDLQAMLSVIRNDYVDDAPLQRLRHKVMSLLQ